MGSPLGPVITGIFMVELERALMPKLKDHMNPWKRYVDDTIAMIKIGSVEYIITALNSFHASIDFTYELETYGTIPFLDTLIINDENGIKMKVYRKPTSTDLYLHWESHAPEGWKRGTVKTLIRRAHVIC